MMENVSRTQIEKELISGAWKPNIYLTNLSLAYFQEQQDFVATKLFPVVPVKLPTSKYYVFSKADLARDNMQRKPSFGKVMPAAIGLSEDSYDCKVDQLIMGTDQIAAIPFQRTNAPGAADPRKARIRTATEQAHLHLDVIFSKKFFQSGVWTNEWAGKASSPSTNEFLRFDVSGSDPIQFIDERIMDIRRNGRRKVNKIALGYETYLALRNNAAVIDRIKYNAGPTNPASVNEKVLANLLGVEEVLVMASTYNAAKEGQNENMQFVCDSKGMLMVYTPETPQIDTPSAGYTFAWDILGGNQYIAVTEYLGEPGTHTEFTEMLCAYDMKQTGQDLACYCKDCVS